MLKWELDITSVVKQQRTRARAHSFVNVLEIISVKIFLI
jgi:hypothetical protein